MHLFKNKVITLALLLVFALPGFAQFKINEYSCANISGPAPFTDAFGGTPDWFEIYNTSSSPRQIGGYYVSDDPNYVAKWQIPINTTIPAQGFLLIYASGHDTVIQGPPIEYHTNFDLLQTKPEKIILSNNNGVVVDSITLRRHQHNHTWGRVPNGNGSWKIFPKNAGGNPTGTPGATNVGPKAFNNYLPSPIFDLPGGFYSGSQQLTLSLPNGLIGVSIWFTGAGAPPVPPLVIGSDPSTTNTAQKQNYIGGTISIDSTTVIRAYIDTPSVGGSGGYLPSFVETNTYIINGTNVIPGRPGEYFNTDFTLPVVSVSYDPTTTGFYPGSAQPLPSSAMISMEYFNKNHVFKFKTVGLANPGSSDDIQFPFYGGFNYSANDEYGFSYINKQQLYTDNTLGASGRTEQTTIQFKTAGSDNFPYEFTLSNPAMHYRDALAQTYGMKAGLNIDGSHYQPCIMYINGRYYGIFEIRENFDTEYTQYYYGTDNIESLENDGGLFGSPTPTAQSSWGSMVSFITGNNMANDSLRAIADSMLNFSSLIDLIVYNSYMVNAGFPTKAAWWRSTDTVTGIIKWRYRMYDMDDIVGLNDNTAGLPNTGPDATVCQYEQTYGTLLDSSLAHIAIFNSLMVSDTFKSQVINRYSYLLNTSLRCPPIIAQLNYIRNILKPEIVQHCYNFGLNDTIWNISVDTTIYWINQRCPTLQEDIKTCYNVTGPYSFCTDVEPKESGTVILNGVSYPEEHSDNYFGNVYFDAIASPAPNYVFDHWELTGFTLPASMLKNDTLHWKFDSISCATAVFKLKEPYQLIGEPSVPTGFSPNGDGNNDVLNVYGTLNVSDYNFQVYNRWGQKIFESNDKTKGWDGTYKGQEVPVGVYAYVFKVVLDGKTIQKSGSITLIR